MTLEKAKQWLESHTQIRWTTEPGEGEEGISLDELNRRPNKYASWLAAFAAEQNRDLIAERDGLLT